MSESIVSLGSTRNSFYTPLYAIHNAERYLCTHSGLSQYSEGGTASCGLAALNCARLVLDWERRGIQGDELINRMLDKRAMQVRRETSVKDGIHALAGNHVNLFILAEQRSLRARRYPQDAIFFCVIELDHLCIPNTELCFLRWHAEVGILDPPYT